MNYSEEIKKLQARVDELEKKLPTESLISCSPVESNLKIAKLTQAELEKLKLQHEFKVGDRVRFKTWKELENEFGKVKSEFGIRFIELPSGLNFIESKKYLGGTYATISEIKEDGQVFLKDFSKESKYNHFWGYSLDMLKPATEKPRWSFTEDEKTILRNLDKRYNWIARDRDNSLWVFTVKPKKMRKEKDWEIDGCFDDIGDCIILKTLFTCIKWSDDEPCEFRKFL